MGIEPVPGGIEIDDIERDRRVLHPEGKRAVAIIGEQHGIAGAEILPVHSPRARSAGSSASSASRVICPVAVSSVTVIVSAAWIAGATTSPSSRSVNLTQRNIDHDKDQRQQTELHHSSRPGHNRSGNRMFGKILTGAGKLTAQLDNKPFQHTGKADEGRTSGATIIGASRR